MLNYKRVLFTAVFILFSFNSIADDKKYDVVAIGKAMVDIVSFVSDEQLIELMPKGFKKSDSNRIDGEFVNSLFKKLKDYKVIPGGSEANVIADIASLGGKTAFNTIAVNDKWGVLFKESLEKENVAYLSKFHNDPNKSTALCFTFITPDKDRTFAVFASLSDSLDESYVNFEAIKESKIFYSDASNLDGRGTQSEIIRKAFDVAKANSVKIAFNSNNNYYVEKHREEIISLLKNVDIFITNDAEALNLFKVKTVDQAISEYLKFVDIAVVTSGKDGAIIATKDERIHIPAYGDDSKIVDLNGAGDSFMAGFLYGITHGFDLKKSGEIAAKTASVIISQVGARPKTSLAESVLSDNFSISKID